MNDPGENRSYVKASNLKAKAIRGTFSYFIRQVLVSGVGLLSNLFILRWLSPRDFGYFATINLVLGIAQIVAEGGLSVYLIQREREIDDNVLSEIASLQLLLYGVVHTIVLIILIALYFFNGKEDMLIYVFITMFCIPINIFRANSFAGLERHMIFDKIAIIEVTESLVFATISLIFAVMGMGVWSLILGAIIRSFVGYVISYSYCKWKFCFRRPRLTKDLKIGIRFGINYHIPALVTTLRLAINPIMVGGLLGMGAVGIADRAIYFAGLPLFFLSAIQQRVLFPYFSRIQADSNMVRSNFEKSYYLSAIIDKIFYIPMVLFGSGLINLFFPKWSQTIPLIYVAMIGNIIFGALAFSSYPVLNGMGKSSAIAVMSVFSMVISWIFTWPLIKTFGLVGYAYIGLLLWFAGAVPGNIILNKVLNGFSLWRPLMVPLVSASCGCVPIWIYTKSLTAITLPLVFLFSLLAILLYFIFLVLIDGRYILRMISQLRGAWSPA